MGSTEEADKTPETTVGPNADDTAHADLSVAFRNALKLGLSLLATWAVALGVRFILPRFLGPERFGQYNWAESSAALAFLLAGLGLDTYIQREVSVRPDHASDFFGGIVAVRAAISTVLLAGVYVYIAHKEPSTDLRLAGIVFAVTQALVIMNASLAALLQASTKVGGLAIANVVTKLVWGVGVIGVVTVTNHYYLLALPLLVGEALKSLMLWPTVRREVGLKLVWNPTVTKVVLITCLPFFVNTISYTMGNKLDIMLLKELADPSEVGYYAAAQNIASLAMLLAPLEAWVITPLLTRAIKRDQDEFFLILRRAIEGILVVALPATMMISFGAEFWMRLACGPKFLPGSSSLEQLAPSFVFTYAAVLLATALIIQKRAWTVTVISLSRLALQPVLMYVLVPLMAKLLNRPGAAGMGDALVFTILEVYVSVAFLIALGKKAFDKRSAAALAKSMVALGASYGVHRALANAGPIRLVADAGVYAAVALAIGAVRPSDVKWVLHTIRNRRRGGGDA